MADLLNDGHSAAAHAKLLEANEVRRPAEYSVMAQTRALHLAPARGGVCRMTLPFERGLGLRSLRFENSPEPASKMS